jgi:DNA replication and repair protein RecF
MTLLHTLKVQGVRNIARADLSDMSRINLFYGDNGAGKTSILEALHLLGLGRSFRSNKHLPIIGYQADSSVVYGEVSIGPRLANVSRSLVTVGVQRSRDGVNEIRIDGQRASSVAQLAEIFPLQLINADTFQLLLGSPGIRRQFVDWGVFHVEHTFLDLWRRMQRTLKQRNSLLRRGKIDTSEFSPWDQEFARLAETITDSRTEYFERWLQELLSIVERLWPRSMSLDYSFYPGWDRRLSAFEMLQRQTTRDRELGFTSMGPHRADIKVKVNGLPVGEVLSRGQLKLLSLAMRLAQGSMLGSTGDKQCIYLVDDLPAELDVERRAAVCEILFNMNSQIFLTSVERYGLDLAALEPSTLSVFHVEHGVVHQ